MRRSIGRVPWGRGPRRVALVLFVSAVLLGGRPLLAQDSTLTPAEGWAMGLSVGTLGSGREALPWRYATVGLNAMSLHPGSQGAEIAVVTVPWLLSDGVMSVGVRWGVTLPLAVAPGLLVIPSAGLSMAGAMGEGGAGGVVGYHVEGHRRHRTIAHSFRPHLAQARQRRARDPAPRARSGRHAEEIAPGTRQRRRPNEVSPVATCRARWCCGNRPTIRIHSRIPYSGFHLTKDSMHRTARTLVLAFGGIVAVAHGSNAQAAKGTCRPDDEMSARIVQYFKGVVTPRGAAATKLRDDLGLAGVTADQVSIEHDARACAKAGKAMDKLAEARKEQYALYVVRVGDNYGVVEPSWRSGEWVPAIVFDRHWKLRRMLLAF